MKSKVEIVMDKLAMKTVLDGLRQCQTDLEELENRQTNLWSYLRPSVVEYLTALGGRYSNLSLNTDGNGDAVDAVGVNVVLSQRGDDNDYAHIPIDYFLSDDRVAYLKEAVRIKKLKEIEFKQSYIDFQKRVRLKEYEQLKSEFEKTPA